MTAARTETDRALLRQRLRAEREQFAAQPGFAAAQAALAAHLSDLLVRLEPECLGLYWSIRSEFNAVVALHDDPNCTAFDWALPFTRREPREMHFRRWDRQAPRLVDECRIPASDGAPVVPDVVIVPCVGFTREGYRLGYGGGYFDRFLAAQQHVLAIGVAWSAAELSAAQFTPGPHDRPLALVVTEAGVLG